LLFWKKGKKKKKIPSRRRTLSPQLNRIRFLGLALSMVLSESSRRGGDGSEEDGGKKREHQSRDFFSPKLFPRLAKGFLIEFILNYELIHHSTSLLAEKQSFLKKNFFVASKKRLGLTERNPRIISASSFCSIVSTLLLSLRKMAKK
jgi:hypothetical protein